MARTQYKVLHLRFFGGEDKQRANANEMETWRTFEMHIYYGTDLELSPTTTVIFFQVTMIPVYKKAVLSLDSFQRYTLYRDMHSKRSRITRGGGGSGAMACRASRVTGQLNRNLAVT